MCSTALITSLEIKSISSFVKVAFEGSDRYVLKIFLLLVSLQKSISLEFE